MRVGQGAAVLPHTFPRPCASLVVLSLALRYIPLRLSSSFKTIFFLCKRDHSVKASLYTLKR